MGRNTIIKAILLLALAGLGAGCLPQTENSTAPSLPPSVAGDNLWQPAPGTSWQWQLTGDFDASIEAEVYDLDLFETSPETVAGLHARGKRVLCYLSAGSQEDWRPDAGDFPKEIIGRSYTGWPGERWLDIRRIDLLAPIMGARLDLCAAKGFDGVEADNLDSYQAKTGFPLTAADQRTYVLWLANAAHQRGLSIGLKNNPEQADELLPYVEFAITEDCFAQGWCQSMSPFIEAGKAVFAAEYTDTKTDLAEICPPARELHFSLILKQRELDAWRAGCP